MGRPFFAYILRCSDGSYYAGHTDELTRRLGEHETGATCGYTAVRRGAPSSKDIKEAPQYASHNMNALSFKDKAIKAATSAPRIMPNPRVPSDASEL